MYIQRIIGTAGHVDHGKTALVRALTGVDCDTHPDEKRRGITIHLGFAPLALPNGSRCAVVDVPGHADFLDTMAAGAGGTDAALFTVAADEGVMPQTREHLAVLDLLGVRAGVVALTRCDLADAARREQVRTAVAALLAGTCLAAAPIVGVSAFTGEGLDALRRALAGVLQALGPRPVRGRFRMFIDRAFSVAGHGTVVSGSVLDGAWRAGEPLWLAPGERPVRVRRVECFGEETAEVMAGQRAAFNLAGLDRADLPHGAALYGAPHAGTMLLDVRLRLLPTARMDGVWQTCMFLCGACRAQARVHLLDCDAVAPGGAALAQVHLPAPLAALPGDRFLLRSSSDRRTLSGGEVLDASPAPHRRRRAYQLEQLRALATGEAPALLAAYARRAAAPVELAEAALALRLSPEEAQAAANDAGLVLFHEGDGVALLAPEVAEDLRRRLTDCMRQRAADPAFIGMTAPELAVALNLRTAVARIAVDGLLATMPNLAQGARGWAPPPDPALAVRIEAVRGYFRRESRNIRVKEGFLREMAAAGLDARTVQRVLDWLTAQGEVIRSADQYLPAELVRRARQALEQRCAACPDGLRLAEARNLFGCARDTALALLEYFDAAGVTRREGELRFLANPSHNDEDNTLSNRTNLL